MLYVLLLAGELARVARALHPDGKVVLYEQEEAGCWCRVVEGIEAEVEDIIFGVQKVSNLYGRCVSSVSGVDTESQIHVYLSVSLTARPTLVDPPHKGPNTLTPSDATPEPRSAQRPLPHPRHAPPPIVVGC